MHLERCEAGSRTFPSSDRYECVMFPKQSGGKEPERRLMVNFPERRTHEIPLLFLHPDRGASVKLDGDTQLSSVSFLHVGLKINLNSILGFTSVIPPIEAFLHLMLDDRTWLTVSIHPKGAGSGLSSGLRARQVLPHQNETAATVCCSLKISLLKDHSMKKHLKYQDRSVPLLQIQLLGWTHVQRLTGIYIFTLTAEDAAVFPCSK